MRGLGLGSASATIALATAAACSADTFTGPDSGVDGAAEAASDVAAPDASGDVSFCDRAPLAADGGLRFCSSFDPPQTAAPPYGWTSFNPGCDGGNASGGLDTQVVKSPPVSMRIRRNGACGSFLNYRVPTPQRPTNKFVASVFSADIPVTSSTTLLFEGIWDAEDAGPTRLIWFLVVRDSDFVFRINRNGLLEGELVVTPFTNNKWHDVEVTTDAKTTLTVTIDGVTKTASTAPRPNIAPYFLVGPWSNVGPAVSDIYFDDMLIYEP